MLILSMYDIFKNTTGSVPVFRKKVFLKIQLEVYRYSEKSIVKNTTRSVPIFRRNKTFFKKTPFLVATENQHM